MDGTATGLSELIATESGFVRADDTISKTLTLLREMKSIKNSLTLINQIPPETLALTATFLMKERDLINATAVRLSTLANDIAILPSIVVQR